MYLLTLGPLLALFVVWTIIRLKHRNQQARSQNEEGNIAYVTAWIYIVFLFLPSTASSLFRTFHCAELEADDGREHPRYLVAVSSFRVRERAAAAAAALAAVAVGALGRACSRCRLSSSSLV